MGIIVLIAFLFFCIFVGLTAFGISLLFSGSWLISITGISLCIFPGLFFSFHTGMSLLGLLRPNIAKRIAVCLDKTIRYGDQVESKLEKVTELDHDFREIPYLSELREYRIQAEPPYEEIRLESDEEFMNAHELRYDGEILANLAEQTSTVRRTLYWRGNIQRNEMMSIKLSKTYVSGISHISAASREIIVFTYAPISRLAFKIHFLNLETGQIAKIDTVGSKELYTPTDGLPYTVFGVTEGNFIVTFGTKHLSSYTSQSIPAYTHFYLVSCKDMKVVELIRISLKAGKVTGFTRHGEELAIKTENCFSNNNMPPEFWSLGLSEIAE